MKGRTYRYMTTKAQFPFGFGLSYSDFKIKAADARVYSEKNIEINAKVANDSDVDGRAVLQVYISANEPGAPKYQLKGFKKVLIPKRTTKDVVFELSEDALEVIGNDGKPFISKGEYTVYIGLSQPDEESVSLMGMAPIAVRARL